MMAFFEEIEIGEERLLGVHAFTREAIIDFARQFDPQRFHIDEEAARDSIFEGLCASGWHVAAAAMRAIVETRTKGLAERAERGEALPPLGVSPGLENLRWPNPTRPGDVVTFYNRVLAKRETKRPQWGLVFMRTWGVNQHGREAIVMENRAFVGLPQRLTRPLTRPASRTLRKAPRCRAARAAPSGPAAPRRSRPARPRRARTGPADCRGPQAGSPD